MFPLPVSCRFQEETLDDFADSGVDDLVVSLYQMDLDRTLFLLRSYLRLRLQKVSKQLLYFTTHPLCSFVRALSCPKLNQN